MSSEYKIGIIGLGYVGLPLAVAFSNKFEVVGFDVNQKRISELLNGIDKTLEIEEEKLNKAISENNFLPTGNTEALETCNFYIITVPTPIDQNKRPDLSPLKKASETIGAVLKNGDIVVYESTVYPGVTEEYCVPILEEKSGLKFNQDFYAGYSPERINPGDQLHTVEKILKVTAGSTPEIAEKVDQVYKTVIEAGTFKAATIKVAEAAKVIENSQRDINIAFVNELSKIFHLMDINTQDVLEAAGTKWNFLPFKPGLVGGHCIGVDPYYLAEKAKELGYHPDIILSGRKLNDGMGKYVAERIVKQLIKRNLANGNAKALVLGITFKENCPDIRNSQVPNIIHELKDYGIDCDIYDPHATNQEVEREFGLSLIEKLPQSLSEYKAIILAVSHKDFRELDLSQLDKEKQVIFDVKSFLPKTLITDTL